MKICSIILAMLCLTSCVNVPPYDYSKLSASNPGSILVLPPVNNSVEVAAPYTFISTITRPLAEKGYYVFPVAVIDTLMKENGLPTPAEMHSVPLDKLQEKTGADSVLYVTINDWGQKYQVVSSNLVVDSTAKLVDARTGEVLWDTRLHFVESSDDGGGGLVGALVGAVVTQVVGSMNDRTPQVSSIANNRAINNPKRGLLPGPYKISEKK